MADNVGITPGSGAKAGAHGSVVSSASVWCEHANRLETEFGGDPPWTGCVPA